jgi:hypothetical protein
MALVNTSTGKLRPLFKDGQFYSPRFSEDGKLLAVIPEARAGRALVYDVNTGTTRGEIEISSNADVAFLSGGARLVVADQAEGMIRVRLWEMDKRGARWEAFLPAKECRSLIAVQNAGRVAICTQVPYRTYVLELGSGVVLGWQDLGKIPLGISLRYDMVHLRESLLHVSSLIEREPGGAAPRGGLSTWFERVFFLKEGEEMADHLEQVIDIRTGRTVFQLQDSTVSGAWYSPEGRSLLVRRGERASAKIICYDVPRRNAWNWIIGVPAGIGVLLQCVLTCGHWLVKKARAKSVGPVSRKSA